MAKKIQKKNIKEKINCKDRFCPVHGSKKLKLHGRVFEGIVTKKLHGRVKIEFERILKVPKYERYEKRKTKIHAKLPDCLSNEIEEGDLIHIEETRPTSKMINFVATKIIKKQGEKNESNK
jgi:small subunit ribosomal protein S17